MADAYTHDLWFGSGPAAGFDAGSVRGSLTRQLAAVLIPVIGGVGVNARIDGTNLVLEFDTTHTELSSGHFTTVGAAPNFGLQDYPTIRGAISGSAFTYKGVEYTVREVDANTTGNFVDVDITPRMAARDTLDGLRFQFDNSAGESVNFDVDSSSSQRIDNDVTVNGAAGTRFGFDTTGPFWTAAITNGDWAVLEPIAAHHFLPAFGGAADGWSLDYNATTGMAEWRAPILAIESARVGNTDLFPAAKIPFRRSAGEDAKLTDLALDITLGNFGDMTDARLSPINGQSTQPTLAQARAFTYRANGGRAHSGGVRYENLWFALETENDYDFTQRVNRIILTADAEPDTPVADITRLGTNTAGDRFLFAFRVQNVPAGSQAEIHAQRDAPTTIRNVRIITDDGAQGQFAGGLSETFTRELYARSSTGVPPAPFGGAISANGWTQIPAGWYESPDEPPGSQSSVLYYSQVEITRNAAGVYSLGVWSLPVALSSFNIQYSRVQFPTDSQISAVFQVNPRSEYRRFYVPATGTWTAWQPIFVVEPWLQLLNYSFNIPANANKAIENRIVSIGQTIDLTQRRWLWIRVTGRRLGASAIQTRADRIIRPLDIRYTASNNRPVDWVSTRDVQEYLRLHAVGDNLGIGQGPKAPLDLADGIADEVGLMMSFIGTADNAITRLGLFRPASRNVQYTVQAAVL